MWKVKHQHTLKILSIENLNCSIYVMVFYSFLFIVYSKLNLWYKSGAFNVRTRAQFLCCKFKLLCLLSYQRLCGNTLILLQKVTKFFSLFLRIKIASIFSFNYRINSFCLITLNYFFLKKENFNPILVIFTKKSQLWPPQSGTRYMKQNL